MQESSRRSSMQLITSSLDTSAVDWSKCSILGDPKLMSAGRTASAPYIMKYGDMPVFRLAGSSFIHLPSALSFSLYRLLFKASRIMPLACSTCPLALVCAIDTYFTAMPLSSQKSQKVVLVNWVCKSVIILFGMPRVWLDWGTQLPFLKLLLLKACTQSI